MRQQMFSTLFFNFATFSNSRNNNKALGHLNTPPPPKKKKKKYIIYIYPVDDRLGTGFQASRPDKEIFLLLEVQKPDH